MRRVINRIILRRHIREIETRHPLRILGTLPRGWAAHVFDENAIDLLAEKQEG